MRTIGSKLDETRGIGPGFDFVRIALAICVFGSHSILIAEGEQNQFGVAPLKLIHWSILPMFFALSGFLITGSATRLRLRDFLLNRGIRIIPALAVDICIAALIIGPIFTTLPLRQYFTSYDFYAYFANITGLIHFVLPGVFEQNPFPNTVNGSLWTVPFEIGCYALMSVFIMTGILKSKAATLGTTALVIAAVACTYAFDLDMENQLPHAIYTALHHYFAALGNILYSFFAVGCLFYVFRYYIPFHITVFMGVLAVIALAAYQQLDFLPFFLQQIVLMPLLVYVVVFVGMLKIPPIPLYRRGDYSYGIYLYGYPIQQGLSALYPVTSPVLHFLITLPVITLVAMFSWHCIEKPILKLRKKFSFTARKGDEVVQMPKPMPPEDHAARIPSVTPATSTVS